MAYTGKDTPNIKDEQLGAFSGYVRRPKPAASGATTQIFGENGDDADTILALSLTKYQDVEVFVNIYMIKDANGLIMKENGKYPLISSFIGYVRRSMPHKDGMMAQFFAPNGKDADEVSNLNKSAYQDCLVFVDVRGSLAFKQKEQIIEMDNKEIDMNYADKITKHQKDDFQRKEKHYRKMNEILSMSDFLFRTDVLLTIGKGEDFKQWLLTKNCAHYQDIPCLNEYGIVEVFGLLKPFNYLPACSEHADNMKDVDVQNSTEFKYYEMKHRWLLKEWAWHQMKKNFSYDGDSEPDPAKIIEWAVKNNLDKYLPKRYQPVL